MRVREAAARRLPATVYLREIRALGYEGGISILKDWLQGEYPRLPAPDVIRFETSPGKQAQADWTQVRRGKDKLSAFVGTLGFSRFSFVWFADNERFETLIEAHERFFDAITGVPQTVLYDNMKTVLIDRNVYGPGQHRFHAGFRQFAKHHGFSPRMCAPYRAQTKGKVERFNRYLKESFVWPLESRLKAQGIILDPIRPTRMSVSGCATSPIRASMPRPGSVRWTGLRAKSGTFCHAARLGPRSRPHFRPICASYTCPSTTSRSMTRSGGWHEHPVP